MKVLVACETSGTVANAFEKKGHYAWSCDILPSDNLRENHQLGDAVDIIKSANALDLVIAHPPCTHLASSGARWFKQKRLDGRQKQGIELFFAIRDACEYVGCRYAIENPIGIMSTLWRKPDQIIQPWQFGHGETKATCLWLKGVPELKPTNIVKGREPRIHRMPPSKNRWKIRSKTYQGIADAMATQWGAIDQAKGGE